jgi:hypothetical protein
MLKHNLRAADGIPRVTALFRKIAAREATIFLEPPERHPMVEK